MFCSHTVAHQLHQEPTQVVCKNKEARKRTFFFLCVVFFFPLLCFFFFFFFGVRLDSTRSRKFSTNSSPSEKIRQADNTTSCHNSGTVNSIGISMVPRGTVQTKIVRTNKDRQERTQVVCGSKEARKRLTDSNSTAPMDLGLGTNHVRRYRGMCVYLICTWFENAIF